MKNQVKDAHPQFMPWNKGRLIWQKAALRIAEILAIRMRQEKQDRSTGIANLRKCLVESLGSGTRSRIMWTVNVGYHEISCLQHHVMQHMNAEHQNM